MAVGRSGSFSTTVALAALYSVGLTGAVRGVEPTNPPALSSLAEPPLWPLGMLMLATIQVKRPAKGPVTADILVWTPPRAERIRAMLLIPNNSDSKHVGEHAAMREVAARHGMGIVCLRRFPSEILEHVDTPVETNLLFTVLDAVARESGIAEFRHAPWIAMGKSSRGRFPYRLAWLFPERTIATMTYHGETPVWPIPEWARTQNQTILHVNVNGETEWMGTWYRHVRPCLLNYRARTAWLPHQAVVRGVGHGDYADGHGSDGYSKPVPPGAISRLRVWDYLALFVDKALQLRLPADAYATMGPVPLRPADPDSGYLIHPRAVEERLRARWRPLREADGGYQIVDHIKEPQEVYDGNPGTVPSVSIARKAADVPEPERAKMFWVADRELLEAWLALHSAPEGSSQAPDAKTSTVPEDIVGK